MGYDVSRGLSGAGAGASIGTAIAPGIGTAIGGGIGLLTGFLGGGDDGSELYRQAAAQYDNIVPPEFRRDIEMLELQQGGRLTPEQLERLPQEMQEAYLRKGDAETKQKQAVQLDAMKEYAETGYSPQQALELAKVRNQVNADIKSRLADIKQKGQYYGGVKTLILVLQWNLYKLHPMLLDQKKQCYKTTIKIFQDFVVKKKIEKPLTLKRKILDKDLILKIVEQINCLMPNNVLLPN